MTFNEAFDLYRSFRKKKPEYQPCLVKDGDRFDVIFLNPKVR
jgi:hypothetical protein